MVKTIERESDHLAAMGRGARWCYFIPYDSNYDGNGFVPSLVVEDVAGHVPMTGQGKAAQPWYWGKTYDEAVETCKHANRKRGISDLAASEIVASSMGASNRGRHVPRTQDHSSRVGDEPSFDEFDRPSVGPRCNWYGGCTEIADVELEGLCVFHFDACERTEHAQKQREHEAQQQRAGET